MDAESLFRVNLLLFEMNYLKDADRRNTMVNKCHVPRTVGLDINRKSALWVTIVKSNNLHMG